MTAAVQDMRLSAGGFREYDCRWQFPGEIDLAGVETLGRCIGAQMLARELPPRIVVGRDYRAYSESVQTALIQGLVGAGIQVLDIGLSLSPMAYFAQFELDCAAVAMVTASHNPNGWTGVKIGFETGLTHGPEDMADLRRIVLSGGGNARTGGSVQRVAGMRDAYIDDLCRGVTLTRQLRVVCATGNGTAGWFAPHILRRIGARIIPLHCALDHSFPQYNPNPESLAMLRDMADCVSRTGADLALGFDGDGDRCGVVADDGNEVFADKVGLMLARDLCRTHRAAHFVVDVKSTGLFAADPVLQANGATTEYWKTGHSHMKRRVRETAALAGFEKSGHYFLNAPLGRGYDCAMRVAVELCRLLDRNAPQTFSELRDALPRSFAMPTLSPACPDAVKYAVVNRLRDRVRVMHKGGETFAGHRISDLNMINGVRVELSNGGWALIRASSNTPNLVVVCESTESADDLKRIYTAVDALIRSEPDVGAYDQPFKTV